MLGLPFRYWILFVGMFVNRMGGFVTIFLPLYLTEQRGMSAVEAGVQVSLFGAGSVLASQLGGVLADRWGRRPTMLLGFATGAASMIALGLAVSPVQIAVGAFFMGVCNDLYRPAQFAVMTDIVPPEDRARAFGYAYWSVNFGFGVAAALAGFLARDGYFKLFLGDAITTSAYGIIVFFFVPESRPAKKTQQESVLIAWRDPRFVAFALPQLVVIVVMLQCITTLGLDMRAHGLLPEVFGRTIAWNGVFIVLLQPLVLALTRQVPHGYMLAGAALLVGLGQAVNLLGATEMIYLSGVFVWTLGEIAFSGVSPAIVAELAPVHARGAYQGALQVVWGLATMVAPTLGAAVWSHFGSRALWIGSALAAGVAGLVHLSRMRLRPAVPQ